MKINNFKHDSNNGIIEFEIENNGEINKIYMQGTDYGTSYTDIDDFAENWSDEEYQQLERFLDGCSEMLHQFYH